LQVKIVDNVWVGGLFVVVVCVVFLLLIVSESHVPTEFSCGCASILGGVSDGALI
jgi:hypothetical protein